MTVVTIMRMCFAAEARATSGAHISGADGGWLRPYAHLTSHVVHAHNHTHCNFANNTFANTIVHLSVRVRHLCHCVGREHTVGVDPDAVGSYGGTSGTSRSRFEKDLKPRLRLTCRTSSVPPQSGTNLALRVLTCATSCTTMPNIMVPELSTIALNSEGVVSV